MWRSWPISLVVAVAYFVTGYIGLMMPVYGASITLIWLPTGIAVAALRRWGYRCWWGVSLGALAVNLAIGSSFPLACGIAVGNTLGPLLATLILVRTGFSQELKRSQDILLLGGAGAVGMLVPATLGVLSLTASGNLTDGHVRAWLLWWAGDATGVIATAPLLFAMNRREMLIVLKRRAELGIWAATLVAAGLGVFLFNTGVERPPLPIAFLPLPLILWGAVRYGPIGTSFGIIVLSFCAAASTASGRGLFARSEPIEGTALVWLFMMTCVLLGWLVSALDSTKVHAVETTRLLERALEEVALGVLLADRDRRITYANSGFTRLTGYPEAELLGRSCRILHGPETDPGMAEKLKSSLSHSGIFDGDILNYRKDGTTFWNALLVSPIHDARGELSGFIGIQRDVTDRKSSEAALVRSEEHLRANRDRLDFLVSSCPTVIYTARPAGEFPATFISANVRSQLGYEPEQFTSDPSFWPSRIHPDDASRVIAELTALFEHGHHSCEYRFQSINGDYRWMHDEMLLKRGARGNPTEIIGYWTDVTDRQRAVEALRISESRLNSFFTESSVGMAIYDSECRWTHVNPRLAVMNGLPATDHLGRRPSELLPPEIAASIEANVRRVLDTGIPDINREITGTTPSQPGVIRYGLTTQSPIADASGRITGVGVVVVETTELKLAERDLRASEERYRQLFESNPQPMWVYDLETLAFLAVNSAAITKYGYSRDEFLARTIKDIRPVEDVAALLDNVIRKIDGLEEAGAWRHQLKNGQLIWVQITSHTLTFDSRPAKVVLAWDVTDKLRADVALRESESRYRRAERGTNDGLWEWDITTGDDYFSPRFLELLGYQPGEVPYRVETFANHVHPEDAGGVSAAIDQHLRCGLPYDVEFRLRRKDDEYLWVRSRGLAERDAAGTPVRMTGSITDVSEQRRTDQALRESEEKLRTIIDNEPECVKLLDRNGRVLEMNPAGLRLIEADDLEQVRGSPVCAMVLADARSDFEQLVEAVFRGETGTLVFEMQGLKGTRRTLETHSVPLWDSDHREVRAMLGVTRDITERKRAEDSLRASEERLRIFIENAPAGVAMLDHELRYISCSRRWLIDYGLGDQNLVGRSHYEVFPEVTDRWKEIHRRCLTGVTELCERDRFDRTDGGTSYLRWEIQPWYNAAGAVGGLVFFTEMITDRVKAEEQIKASLHEKESLLKEVHHRVKNNLQIITSLLNLQAETVQDPTTVKLLRESQNRVRSMALVHETLYRSGDFGRIDLATYVDAICNFLSRAYGIDSSRIQIEVYVDDVSLDLDRAIPCGLIINELISNALKYAFPENRNGRITVRLTSNSDEYYTLIVADDGVGLPPELELGRLKSLGLQLVNDLVLQLTGSITMEPSHGTRFCIRFPAKFPQEQRP